MEHLIGYDLARGLHIIAVIAWIAGLLMLPRFYAYITASQPGGELEAAMLKAARSLRIIILIAAASSWPGRSASSCSRPTWSATGPAHSRRARPRPALVLGQADPGGGLERLPGLPICCRDGSWLPASARHSEKFWRLMSEVPFLVAIAAVLLATLEP